MVEDIMYQHYIALYEHYYISVTQSLLKLYISDIVADMMPEHYKGIVCRFNADIMFSATKQSRLSLYTATQQYIG